MLIMTGFELYTPRQVIPDAVLVMVAGRTVSAGPVAEAEFFY